MQREQNKYKTITKQALLKLNELVFPFDSRCSLCASEAGMNRGFGICKACEDALPTMHSITDLGALECIYAFDHTGQVRKMVARLKFSGQKYFARTLGQYLAQAYIKSSINADIIIPVPLHSERKKQRGFNQSELLANEVSNICNIDMDNTALVRTKNTLPQTELDMGNRQRNVSGAFEIVKPISKKHVLLVDDVLTTGSTLLECAKQLEQNGALCTAIVVSKAVHHGADIV